MTAIKRLKKLEVGQRRGGGEQLLITTIIIVMANPKNDQTGSLLKFTEMFYLHAQNLFVCVFYRTLSSCYFLCGFFQIYLTSF